MKNQKLAHFLFYPRQYFSPLFWLMAKQKDLTLFYYSDLSIRGGMNKGFEKREKWDIPLLEGYKSIFLANIAEPIPLIPAPNTTTYFFFILILMLQ